LTALRHGMINNESLVKASKSFNLIDHVIHREKFETVNNTDVGDVFESLIGAIFIDKKGFYICKNKSTEREIDVFSEFIHRFLLDSVTDLSCDEFLNKNKFMLFINILDYKNVVKFYLKVFLFILNSQKMIFSLPLCRKKFKLK
jgi:phosphoribosylformylglycinamidine (FGAM) synthase-like enzyme